MQSIHNMHGNIDFHEAQFCVKWSIMSAHSTGKIVWLEILLSLEVLKAINMPIHYLIPACDKIIYQSLGPHLLTRFN